MDMEAVRFLATCALMVFIFAGLWGVFKKAGRPGWYALIPVYNMVTLCRVSGITGWFALVMIIPLVNFVGLIYVAIQLAKSFGKGIGYAFGIVFLGFAFLPVLGFGEARYVGPGGAAADGADGAIAAG